MTAGQTSPAARLAADVAPPPPRPRDSSPAR